MNQGALREGEVVFHVGTRKLIALADGGGAGDGEPRVTRHIEIANPEGFENGLVTHLEKAAHTLETAAESLLSSFGAKWEGDLSAYVVLGNAKLRTYAFSSSQYFQGLRRTISSHEIRSVVAQTRSVATLPLSEFMLQVLPESFLVDDMENVENPLGLEAHRLGVFLKIFTMDFQAFKNVSKAFEAAEIDVKGYFPQTLTTSEAVLKDEEKEEGVLIMDIQDDATHLILWKNRQLLNTRVVDIGGRDLTGQIAGEWKIDLHDAEKVKEQFGSLESNGRFGDELIPLIDRNGKGHCQVHRKAFQEKFLEQAKEWMERLLEESRVFTAAAKVHHPHFVFTGAETSLDGFLEFLQKQFSLEARIGVTRKMEAPAELLLDPSFCPALGMFRWLATNARQQERLIEPRGLFEKTVASARGWFSAYF